MYALLHLRRHLDTWKEKWFGLAGNTKPPQTVTIEGVQVLQVPNATMRAPFAWFAPDERCDRLAAAIKYTNHVITLLSGRQYELWATCTTSAVSDIRTAGIEYPRFAQSEREAEQWEVENVTWYSAHYADAIMPTLDRKTFPQGYSSVTAPSLFFKPQPLLHLPAQTGQLPAAVVVLPLPTLNVTIPALEADIDDMAISLLEDDMPGAASICFPGAEEPAPVSELGKAEDTHGSNIHAIAFQAQQRVEHEVAQLLPKLHGLANILGDAPRLHITEDVFELQTVLETILEQVHNCLSGIEVYGQEGSEARGGKTTVGPRRR
ncbi:hypothetical protein EWM64_g4894 [Hericium alpestre]|uniref:Uncharacterized protein n=1 Tax=Hericium alpestre TaxID=135208 RepID=A0A4Z0A081_9AGAM|nr:hypothetical protein EWM64_g4894 [Hericium alpestre]